MNFLTRMASVFAASLSVGDRTKELLIALVFFVLGYFFGKKRQKKADKKQQVPKNLPKQTMTMAQKQEAKGEKRNQKAAQAASRQPERKLGPKPVQPPVKVQQAPPEPERRQQVTDIPKERSSLPEPEKEQPKSPEKEILWYEDTQQEAVPEPTPEPPEPAQETEEDRIGKILGEFTPVEALGMDFQYAFPDNVLFQPGKGYLRSAQNELCPDAETLGSMSRTVAYAMNGLFRVYDVVYRGKLYTFQQIMDREMGEGYVRIQAVAAPALIQESGFYNCYRLVKKGKLEVADA